MVKEIRIYVEGGGDSKSGKTAIRRGFSEFLREINTRIREKSIRWNITACGPRNNAFEDFCFALQSHPDAFNILLVDSEGPVNKNPWEHLKDRDNWDKPETEDENCHLMVQIMESWFLADIDKLEDFYGQGFNRNQLPKNPKIEEIEKKRVESSLKKATSETQKGEYHEIRHGPKILAMLDSLKIRDRADHCDRLFNTLEEIIQNA